MFRFKFIFDYFQAKSMSGPYVEINMWAKWLSRLCPDDLEIGFAPNTGQVPIYDDKFIKIISKESPADWNHYTQNYTNDFTLVQETGKQLSLGPHIDLTIPFNKEIPLVVSSNYFKRITLSTLNYQPKKIFVIPNTVDPEIFYPRKKAQKITVGWIGHDIGNHMIKGPEVIPYLAHKFPDIQFEMVHSAKPTNQNLWMRGDLPNLKILYEIPHYKLPEIIGRWHILISGSRDENSPNHILEAMSSGVPVIAAAVGGISEIAKSQILLSDMKWGHPPEVDFPHKWTQESLERYAQVLEHLLIDRKKYESLILSALQESNKFNPRIISQKWFELIYVCRDLYS